MSPHPSSANDGIMVNHVIIWINKLDKLVFITNEYEVNIITSYDNSGIGRSKGRERT